MGHTVLFSPFNLLQLDIVVMLKYEKNNKGYGYIFCVIDVFHVRCGVIQWVIANINSEEIGVLNNERFEMIKYDTLQITMKHEKKEIKIGVFDFQKIISCCVLYYNSQLTRDEYR